MAAALLVVPGLLVLFHRLSRTPPMPWTALQATDVADRPPLAGPGPLVAPEGLSVADEAERWLRSRHP